MSDAMLIGSARQPAVEQFRTILDTMPAPRVLELGTRRSDPTFPTHHAAWMPGAAEYVMSDVEDGTDVDVVCDAHDLTGTFGAGRFDVVIAVSVWEHLARPWLAMCQAAAVLAPDGLLLVETHHTFPLHGYPSDYFRFSTEALTVLADDAGLDVVATGYTYPATITPPAVVTRWNPAAEAWLNVTLVARK